MNVLKEGEAIVVRKGSLLDEFSSLLQTQTPLSYRPIRGNDVFVKSRERGAQLLTKNVATSAAKAIACRMTR